MVNTIVIDAPCGGEVTGNVGIGGIEEKTLNVVIARTLGNLLFENGVADIKMTRTDDEFYSLRERIDYCNNMGADLVISIQMLANDDPNVRGWSLVGGDTRLVSHMTAGIAPRLKDLSPNFLNLAEDSNLLRPHAMQGTLISNLQMPTLVFFAGFVTNPADVSIVQSRETRDRMVLGLAEGVVSYIDSFNQVKRETDKVKIAIEEIRQKLTALEQLLYEEEINE